MESFRQYITEAAFFNKDLQKVCDKLSRVVSRKSGIPMYQYGGSGHAIGFKKSRSGKGLGILYLLSNNGDAVRFEWIASSSRSVSITSATYYNNWNIENPKPDFQMTGLEHLNIVQLADALSQFVKSPSTPVKVKINESTSSLTEAVDLKVLANAAYQEYGVTELKVSEFKSFAQRLGKKINQYQSLKLPKKERGVVDLSVLMEVESAESEDIVADSTEKKIKAAVDKVPVDVLFKDLADLSDLVISGARPSLLITGSGGTGKSYTVIQRLKEAGLKKGVDYDIKKGATSTFGLYMDLFLARKGKLLIFDDNDDVFKDMTSQNLLKAALDSYDDREIAWTSKNTIPIDQSMDRRQIEDIERGIEADLKAGEEKVKLPSIFKFDGRVIFISNMPEDKIPQPIRSRSITIDVTLTDNEMLDRMKMVIPVVAKETGIDESGATEVLDKLMSLAEEGKIAKPTMRTLPAAIAIKKSGMPRWEELLKYAAKA